MTKRTKFILLILAWAALAGLGPVMATKDQIMKTLAGNTLFEDAPTYNWAAYYLPKGIARARGWSWLGDEEAIGHWHVSSDGLFCVTWNRKDWAGGTENCYRVELQGQKAVLRHVSGKSGGDRTLVLKNGNPYDL